MPLLRHLARLACLVGLTGLTGLTAACSGQPDEVIPEDDLDGGKADGVASSCFATNVDQLAPVSPGAARTLGGFQVTVAPDARLEVRHAALAARPVFASAAGAAFEAARATLDAPDRQGSFELIETTQVACRRPKVASLRAGQRVLAARGGFDDAEAACRGLTWELQLCQPRAGHLSFRLTTSDPSFDQLTLRAASDADEKIFGMGEQFGRDTLDLKGRAIPVIAQEGGVGRGHTPISPAVNAVSPGSAGSEASTYYAAPHILTTRLRSLFLENSEPSVFDFTAQDAIVIRLHASTMSGRILAGASPLELIERFTEYAGRMPAPPHWANEGAIVALASDPATSLRRIDALRAHGAVLSAVWNQTWSGKVTTYIGEQVLWNWVPSSTWRAYADQLAARNLRSLCYVNPMLVDPPASAGPVERNLFREARDAGYLVTHANGEPYLQKITAFEVGLIDLSNPDARTWFKKVIKNEVLGHGRCSGWMADFGEALPFDAHLASGATGADWHNQYPVQWMRLNREAIQEAGRLGDVLTFNRSGYTRTPAYSQTGTSAFGGIAWISS